MSRGSVVPPRERLRRCPRCVSQVEYIPYIPTVLDRAVLAVAGVAEAGDDVAGVVEAFVDAGGDEADGEAGLGEVLDPFRRGEGADGGDVGGAAGGEEADRVLHGAAGGEHGVEHEDGAVGEVVR